MGKGTTKTSFRGVGTRKGKMRGQALTKRQEKNIWGSRRKSQETEEVHSEGRTVKKGKVGVGNLQSIKSY